MRVLVVGPSLDILGGQSVQAHRLLEGLVQSQKVHVNFLAVNPRLPGVLRILQRVKYLRTVVTSIAYFASLVWRVPRCDVVHAFSASYYSYLLAPLPALLAARLFGRRAILNYHSGEAGDHLAHWPLSRWSIRKIPHAVVVPSAYLVEVFARFGIRAQAIVNFVPLEKLPYRRRDICAPKILSNRNLEPMYNVACCIRAFALIQHAKPDAELLVAGDGSQRQVLESLSRDLALRNVSFLGRVSPSQIGALYDRCDIYINASIIDNMPLSIIEAFACGLPVVTSNAGGIPYIVVDEKTGLLVARNDVDALASAVLRLLDHPPLATRLADAARAECDAHYVWPEVMAQWENYYQKIAAGRSS